jgi:hypothetical protein
MGSGARRNRAGFAGTARWRDKERAWIAAAKDETTDQNVIAGLDVGAHREVAEFAR